jgi:hypothetical protein
MPLLRPEYAYCQTEFDRPIDLGRNIGHLEPAYQKLVAEIALLRAFDLFQNTIKNIATKIVCGAAYLDGSQAVVVLRCRGIANAVDAMMTHGRQRPRSLRWSTVADIKENVKHVLDPSDHVVKILDQHGTLIDECRRVRNRIAHNNRSTRADFQVVVRRHYGANLNYVTPGMLLLSTRRTPRLLEQRLSELKVLMRATVKG